MEFAIKLNHSSEKSKLIFNTSFMKTRFIILIAYFAIPFALFSQKEISSKVSEATVYFNGAQITREVKVQIQTGTNVLLFSDLPQNINPKTIVVESNSAITLLSVKHNLNYLKNQEKPKEVTKMEDSLKLLQQKLLLKNSILQVFREEESMLIANKSIGGENTGVQSENLKNSADFFRQRLTDIKTRQYELSLEIQKINETIQRLNNQISQLMSNRNGPVSEIFVTVSAKTNLTASLKISYYLPNAQWIPMYDIRATDVGKPVRLSLKAGVYNNTGENWENANITLSSTNPLESGVKPLLRPWYLFPYTAVTRGSKDYAAKESAAPVAADMGGMIREEVYTTTASHTSVQQNLTTIEYVISIPYSIPADGKEYTVDIQEFTLPASYEYQCVPKIDRDAFLIARISGWEQYNLLPGQSNLFAEGKFIGNSYIDPASVKDTLDISLGRDKSITVNRELLKDFSSEKLIGSNKSIVRTYETSIRNRKNSSITLVLEDQIPLSNQKDIVVEFDSKKADGAEYNETTGMLRWKLTIQPGETVKVKYSYTVKHPKDMSLQVW